MRTISSPALAQIMARTKRLAFFFQCNFKSGAFNLWTGRGARLWNGLTWQGIGGIIAVQTSGESTEVAAKQAIFTLSGVDPAYLVSVLDDTGHNLKATLWLAFLDDSDAIVDDPLLIDSGLMDGAKIVESVDGPALQLTFTNRLADLERARLRNYTDADQQLLSPGDTGFRFVPNVQEWDGQWGDGTNSTGPTVPAVPANTFITRFLDAA